MQRSKSTIRKVPFKALLRQRIHAFYAHFNQENWQGCFRFLDPALRDKAKVELEKYAVSLANFKHYYGLIRPLFMEIKLITNVQSRTDARDFAYVAVFWKDSKNAYHLFRERWVKDKGRWFTRVVGLVTHEGA